MLHSRGEPSFAHSPRAWVTVAGRSWPLMLVPYVGAVAFYLYVPVFALFGPGLLVARVVAALLAAWGIWGVGRLMGTAAGAAAAGALALALAVHPSYVSNTLFNDSALAYWMGVVGLACVGLRAYLSRPTATRAALLGVICGFGVWARLNFAWLLAAAALGALVGFGRRALPPIRHAAAAAAGALLGSAPLLWYLARTSGSEVMAFMAPYAALPRPIVRRVRLLAATLVYDGEHRHHVWGGPEHLPSWLTALAAAIVLAATAYAFVGRGEEGVLRRWHRAAATLFLVLSAYMMRSRLPVREHHLAVLLPVAFACVVLAARRLPRHAASRAAVVGLASLYAAMALFWDVSAVRGLARNDPGAPWSRVVLEVARDLDARRAPRLAYLDWGYHNSIYTITNGRVDGREMFWYPPDAPEAPAWRQEIAAGGVYVTHARGYMNALGEPATARFRRVLDQLGLAYSRRVFNDARGRPHTELFEVHAAP